MSLFIALVNIINWIVVAYQVSLGAIAAAGTVTGIIAGVTYIKSKFVHLKPQNSKGKRKDWLIHPYSELATTNWTSPDDWTPPSDWTISVNWTQGSKIEQSLVFYQDPSQGIIASSRIHPYTGWSTVNITEELERSNHSIRARLGTPMAATASPGSPFEVVLYFFDHYNKTVEVRSKDHDLRWWKQSDLGYQSNDINWASMGNETGVGNQTHLANKTHFANQPHFRNQTHFANHTPFTNHTYLTNQSNRPNETKSDNMTGIGNQTNLHTYLHTDYFSQLAAHWFDCLPYCENSTDGVNQARIFFQKTNKLNGATSLPWSKTGLIADMDAGSGIATTPYVPREGPPEMRLVYSNSTRLMLKKWRNETGWEFDDRFMNMAPLKSFTGQTIAATTFPVIKPKFPSDRPIIGPSFYLMILQLELKGAVSAMYWDPLSEDWISHRRLAFHGSKRKPRFSRIATNHNGTLYGIRDGEIHEYAVDLRRPNIFQHVSRVALRGLRVDIRKE